MSSFSWRTFYHRSDTSFSPFSLIFSLPILICCRLSWIAFKVFASSFFLCFINFAVSFLIALNYWFFSCAIKNCLSFITTELCWVIGTIEDSWVWLTSSTGTPTVCWELLTAVLDETFAILRFYCGEGDVLWLWNMAWCRDLTAFCRFFSSFSRIYSSSRCCASFWARDFRIIFTFCLVSSMILTALSSSASSS